MGWRLETRRDLPERLWIPPLVCPQLRRKPMRFMCMPGSRVLPGLGVCVAGPRVERRVCSGCVPDLVAFWTPGPGRRGSQEGPSSACVEIDSATLLSPAPPDFPCVSHDTGPRAQSEACVCVCGPTPAAVSPAPALPRAPDLSLAVSGDTAVTCVCVCVWRRGTHVVGPRLRDPQQSHPSSPQLLPPQGPAQSCRPGAQGMVGDVCLIELRPLPPATVGLSSEQG